MTNTSPPLVAVSPPERPPEGPLSFEELIRKIREAEGKLGNPGSES
jgi:hypothetical protein